MDVSKFLAKVLGLYLVIVTAVMLLNMQQFLLSLNKLIANEPLMFITGFFTLILGLVMVVSHNFWQWNWRIIITIFSWIALLKGITLILYPQFLDNITVLFIHNTHIAYTAATIDFFLGLLLCYLGFKR